MKIIDNFELIRNHMSFNNSNEFYFLQILQRKKDGNEDLHVRNGFRLIKSYYIYSIEDFDELKSRIIELCHNNNARAYINPNVRNAQEVALECIKRYAELVANNNAFQGNAIWDSACGSIRARGYKELNIVDIDNIEYLDKYKKIILSCRGNDGDRIVYEVPTVHGVHLITRGFDTRQFQQYCVIENLPQVNICKNNPTLLYYDLYGQKK